jgi:bisanhydrobacterioruberin hydratase
MERAQHYMNIVLLYLIFLFGVLWHSITPIRELVLFLTAPALILSFLLVLYPEYKQRNNSVILWLVSVAVITFFIEVIGVSTSLIFGSYKYGNTLGVAVLEVPLIIGFNWAIIIWGSSELADRLKFNRLIKVLIAASAAVLIDFLIEPVAMKFNYWQWSGSVIPYRNYIAWFVIALFFSSSYFYFKQKSSTTLPIHFYITQIIFFGGLNLIRI